MSEEKSRYSDLLNVWPPPNEETRARLQRLQELEEQRHNSSQERTRSSSLDRSSNSSSSRENLGGYRGLSRTSSFRTHGRRTGGSSSVLDNVSSIRESRGLRRSNSAAARSARPTAAATGSKLDSGELTVAEPDESSESNVDRNKSEQVNTEKTSRSSVESEKVNQFSKSAESGTAAATGTLQLTTGKKADTEIGTSSRSPKTWTLSGEGEKRLEQITGDTQARLREIQEMRSRTRKAVEQDDSSLTARERFNLNPNPIARPSRQPSVQQQLRKSRQARRHSDLQLSSTSTFGTENASSESSAPPREKPSVRTSERSRVIDIDSLDRAIDDTSERMKRIEQLKILRERGREAMADMDPNILSSSESLGPTYDTSSNRLFPLSSTSRSGSVPSLTSSGRTHETTTHFPSIAEQREPQSYMSTPAISSHTFSSELSINTDTSSMFLEPETLLENTDTVALPLSSERTGSVPSTASRFNEFVRRSAVLTRQSSAPVLGNRIETSYAARLRKRHKGLPEELQDLYLAECFDPKYNLKERVVLIRKKLWGDPPNYKSNERGKPDGASQSENNSADNESNNTEVTATVNSSSENTKSI